MSGLLAGLILCIFFQSIHFEFISFDDVILVMDNPNITGGLSLDFFRWAFSTYLGGNWNPVVWVSFAIDYQLFGHSPQGYHAVNIFLHIVNSILLFKLLYKATRHLNKSFIVAVIFAVHPQHVEVVAWVSARKDLLSSLFGFLSIYSYIVAKENNDKLYKTAIYMALSLMAKPMFVTLPFLLLLLDVWPLKRVEGEGFPVQRVWQLVAEKWLLFLICIAGCVVGYISHSSADAISQLDITETVSNLVHAYMFYMIKLFYPVHLSIFYPFHIPGLYLSIFYFFLLAGFSFLALFVFRKAPWFFLGWFWYLGMLFPVSGVVQFGGHSFADRFSYIPHVGLIIVIVWGVALLIERLKLGRPFVAGIVMLFVSALSVLTVVQVGYWENSYTLFKHTENIVGEDSFVYAKVAQAYSSSQQYEKALSYNIKAMDLLDKQSFVVEGLSLHLIRENGFLLYKIGEFEASLHYLKNAVSNNPNDKESLELMVNVLHQLGRHQEAQAIARQLN